MCNQERYVFCDAGAFNDLSGNEAFNKFLQRLAASKGQLEQELSRAILKNLIIVEPIVLIEYSGMHQDIINKNLQEQVTGLELQQQVKALLDKYITEYKGAVKQGICSDKAYVEFLSHGFCLVVDFLYDHLCASLLQTNDIVEEIQLRFAEKKEAFDKKEGASPLFMKLYEYDLRSRKEELISHIALEAILRYGSLVYTDNGLKNWWKHYVVSYYFELWKKKLNVGMYRNINGELFSYNQKSDKKFLPDLNADGHDTCLKQHADTLDVYLVHFLAYGWFDLKGNLSPILGLTCDSKTRVCARVQQYQSFLSYATNHNLDDLSAATLRYNRLSYRIQPGVLFTLDRKTQNINHEDFSE